MLFQNGATVKLSYKAFLKDVKVEAFLLPIETKSLKTMLFKKFTRHLKHFSAI